MNSQNSHAPARFAFVVPLISDEAVTLVPMVHLISEGSWIPLVLYLILGVLTQAANIQYSLRTRIPADSMSTLCSALLSFRHPRQVVVYPIAEG